MTEPTTSCQHQPACPADDASDRDAAHVLQAHPEQGWSLLCNGVVLFEDGGDACGSACHGEHRCPSRKAHRVETPERVTA
jgi:hypothetical protein